MLIKKSNLILIENKIMNIDNQTLSLIISISFVLQSLALLLLYLQSSRYKGIKHWALGSVMLAIGSFSIMLRLVPEIENLAIIASNVFHVSGILFIYFGTCSFTNRKNHYKRHLLFLGLFFAVVVYFTCFNNQLNLRTLIYSFSISFICFLISRLLFGYKTKSIKEPSFLVSVIFFLMSVFFLFRTLYNLTTPVSDFFETTIIQSSTFIIGYVFSFLWSFGLIILVNQRLYDERAEVQKHFELIFNKNPDLALIIKLPEKSIVGVNESFIRSTGYSKEELFNYSSSETLCDNTSCEEIGRLVHILYESGACTNQEILIKRKDQSDLNGLLSANSINFQDTPHLICLIRDTTVLKEAERKIMISEKRYRSLFENAPIGIFTTTIEGKTISANPYLARLLGFSDSNEAISYYTDLKNQLYLNQIRRNEFLKLIEENYRVENFEYQAQTFDGRLLWLSMNAIKVVNNQGQEFLEGFTSDISQRKRNEAELSEKELQYRNLANAGVALIWTASSENQRTFFNVPWLKFTGRSIDQELGIGWLGNVHPEDQQRVSDIYVLYNEHHEPFQLEYRLLHYSGVYRWVNEMGTPNYNSKGNFIGYIGYCFDIDDRKKLEFELIAAKEKAEESDRLKTSFLANLSHEIRTPMNSILGFASLLPEVKDADQITSYSNIIVNNSEQLAHIIDDIVIYSQLQTRLFSFNPSEFCLEDLFIQIQQSFNLPKYNENVELIVETYNDTLVKLFSDFEKLKQLLVNLVSNAFKYAPSGYIRLGYQKSDDYLTIYVEDNGVGIPVDECEKVFDRFYRGSNINKIKISGTGLGLSIARELTEILGGTIWVESAANQGAKFFIKLPCRSRKSNN